MSRPNNNLFDRPPAYATRSSTSDSIVSPEFHSAAVRTSATAITAPPTPIPKPPQLVTTSSQLPSTPVTTTSAAAPSSPIHPDLQQPPIVMEDLGEGTSAGASAAVTSAPPSTTTATMTTSTGADGSFAPPPFRGTDREEAETWLVRFEKYAAYRGFPEQEVNFLAVLLRDDAGDWYDTLETNTKASWAALKAAFEQRFQDSDLMRWRKASEMWNRMQLAGESVDTYVTNIRKFARAVGVEGDQLRYAIQRGLRPALLAHVIQSQPSTVDELIRAARVAEAASLATAAASSADPSFDHVVAELAANRQAAEQNTIELRKFTTQLASKSVSTVVTPRSPSPSPRPSTPRRVTFDNNAGWEQPTGPRRQQSWRGRSMGAPQRPMMVGQQPPSMVNSCQYCGGTHLRGPQYCRAAGVTCFNCKKVGHLARLCRSARRPAVDFGGPPNFSA